MGLNDRIENKTEDLTGRGKEAVGAATDDESLKNEGKADQGKAGVKDKVQDAKDAVSKKIGEI